jgi:WD40 repeat protein
MSEESLERYGGVLAAPPRHLWRRAFIAGAVVLAVLALVIAIVQFRAASAAPRALPGVAASQTLEAVAFSPDGRTLATVGMDFSNDGGTDSLYLWNVSTGRRTATLTIPSSPIGAATAAFSPDGAMVLVADGGATVDVWDVATARRIAALADPQAPGEDGGGGAFVAAFSPDGAVVATADSDGSVYLWDVATGRLIATLASRAGQTLASVAFSPDGKTLAAGGQDGDIYVWDTATRRMTATLTDPGGGLVSVAFSPDGRTLASGDGGVTYLWDVATRRRTAAFAEPALNDQTSWTLAAFSPDGKTLAATGDSTYLWDVATGRLVATLTDPGTLGVNSLAFSPAGTLLAAADGDGTVYFWHISRAAP